METNKKRSDCPISCSLDVWGDKWSSTDNQRLNVWKKSVLMVIF